jgi:hypothetical protein
MRLNEIFSEDDINDILPILKKSCNEYILSARQSGRFLYRGIDTERPIMLIDPPPNRMPQGQSLTEQAMLDRILKMTGFTALRSNSRSCTTNPSDALEFGNLYLIFPMDGFSYTWSSRIADVGSNRLLAKRLHDWCPPKNSFSKSGSTPTQDEAERFIEEFEFHKDNLPRAMDIGNEIIVKGRYYAISRYYIDEISTYLDIEEGR